MLEPPGQFLSDFFIKPLFKKLENAPGASWAGSFRFPYLIFIKKHLKMLLEPPGQVPSDVYIKSLLEHNEKCSWSLLGSFLQISLLKRY